MLLISLLWCFWIFRLLCFLQIFAFFWNFIFLAAEKPHVFIEQSYQNSKKSEISSTAQPHCMPNIDQILKGLKFLRFSLLFQSTVTIFFSEFLADRALRACQSVRMWFQCVPGGPSGLFAVFLVLGFAWLLCYKKIEK